MHHYLRPSVARDSTRSLAAVRGIEDLLPAAALAVALASLEEIQPRDGLEDDEMENAPRVELTRCSRKKRVISGYVWLGAVGAGR